MSVPITLTWDNPPAAVCWTGIPDFITLLSTLLHGNVAGNFSGLIISATQPAPADRDKAWLRLSPDGTPDRIYTFLGEWISPNPRPPSTGERIIWTQAESLLWSFDNGNGDNPNSVPPTDTTGAMWMRDTNFDFRFPLGIGSSTEVFDGNPANVAQIGTTQDTAGHAGHERIALDLTHSPPHQHLVCNLDTGANQPPSGSNTVAHFSHPSGALSTDYILEGTATPAVAGLTSLVGGSAGSALSHQNMPPWRAVIFAKRTARRFYTAT